MTQSQTAATPAPGFFFLFALAAISLIGPLAVHIFLPIIPGVRAAFAMSDAMVQANFSVALFTMAFSTLIYGSLADRYGRRPVLLIGLLFFVLGTALCASAYSVTTLLFGRFVQAAGAGCGIALVRTIARDAYGAAGLAKAIAYLTMAYTFGPLMAPMIGGTLHDFYGWRSVFLFAFACALAISFSAWKSIPETRPVADPDSASFGLRTSVLRDYITLFSHWRFGCYVMQSGMSSAIFFTMAAATAALWKDILDRSAAEFGLYFGLFYPTAYFLGNFISTRFIGKARQETMVFAGSMIGLATASIQCLFLLSGVINVITLFLPGFFITFAQGIALPHAQSAAINIVPRLVGTASGIGVFLQSFLGAAFSQLYGVIANGTVVPMVTVTMIGSVIMFTVGFLPWLFRPRLPEEQGA
jgi:DHA1 family bicyclomycin/chloramphenicol resistance-like MFS transporter